MVNRCYDGTMPAKPRAAAVRDTAADAEKLTINLGFVDLGQIDLLVAESFYANRSDFIRTAIRNQLAQHADVVKQAAARKTLVLGLQHITADELRALQAKRQKLRIRVLGLATIESIDVLGALHASPAVKAVLATLPR